MVTFLANAAGRILPRAIAMAAAPNTKTYDGTTSAAATPTITSGSLAAADTAVFQRDLRQPNAGVGQALAPAGSVADGNNGTTTR